MNERIRECWLKAAREDSGKKWDTQEEFIERFAGLIVRECNQAVLEVPLYYKDYRSQIEDAVIRDCARAVLEKFGVE